MELVQWVPREIWQRIFSYLTGPELKTASLVCRLETYFY